MVKNKGKSIKRKRIINVLKTTQGKVVLLIGFLITALFISSVSFAAYDSKFYLSYGASITYQYTTVTGVPVGGNLILTTASNTVATDINTLTDKLFVDMQDYLLYSQAQITTCQLIHSISGTVVLTGILSSYLNPNALASEDYKTAYYYFNDWSKIYNTVQTYHFKFVGALNLVSSIFTMKGLTTGPVAPVTGTTVTLPTGTGIPGLPVFTSSPVDATYANITPSDLVLTWVATDDNFVSATLYFNGVFNGTEMVGVTEYIYSQVFGGWGPGNYTLKLVLLDGNGNSIEDEVKITVVGELPFDIMAWVMANPLIVVVVLFLVIGTGGTTVVASKRSE